MTTFEPLLVVNLDAKATPLENKTTMIHTTTEKSSSSCSPQEELVLIDYNDLVSFYQTFYNHRNDNNDDTKEETVVDSLTNDEKSGKTSITEKKQQLRDRLLQQIEHAYGPNGWGILGVTNIPQFEQQRESLLRLSTRIPLLSDLDTFIDPTSFYSVGWSHGKESLRIGQPDYAKGSYYANPLCDNLKDALIERYRQQQQDEEGTDNDRIETKHQSVIDIEEYYTRMECDHPEFYAPNLWPSESLPELRECFCTMGQTLVQVGQYVAYVCDVYCYTKFHIALQLHNTIQKSLNCKGRLLHYFPSSTYNTAATTNNNNINNNKEEVGTSNDVDTTIDNLWCAWHNDHVSSIK